VLHRKPRFLADTKSVRLETLVLVINVTTCLSPFFGFADLEPLSSTGLPFW